MTRYRFALAPAGLSGPQIREDTQGAGGRGRLLEVGNRCKPSDTIWLWHPSAARSLQRFRANGGCPLEDRCK